MKIIKYLELNNHNYYTLKCAEYNILRGKKEGRNDEWKEGNK